MLGVLSSVLYALAFLMRYTSRGLELIHFAGMFLLKPDGAPVYLNDAFYELTGVRKADIESDSVAPGFWGRSIAPDDRDNVKAAWARLVRDKQPISFEYRGMKTWTANDGVETEFWLRALAYPELNTNNDSIIGIQGWLENVSVQKYTEQMQAKRLEEALEHKRQAEAFLGKQFLIYPLLLCLMSTLSRYDVA
jgi:PAS domain-containing protein